MKLRSDSDTYWELLRAYGEPVIPFNEGFLFRDKKVSKKFLDHMVAAYKWMIYEGKI